MRMINGALNRKINIDHVTKSFVEETMDNNKKLNTA